MSQRQSHRPESVSDSEPPLAKISGRSLRDAYQLARYLWPYREKFVAGLVALALTSLFALVFPYMTGRLVDGTLARWTGQGVDSWQSNVDVVAAVLVGLLLLQSVCSFCKSLWFAEVGQRSLADLRRDAYSLLIRLPLAFHTERRVGELSSRLFADLSQIQDTLIWTIPQFLRQLALLIGGIVLLTWTSPHLTLLTLGSVPVLIGMAIFFGKRIRSISVETQDMLADTHVIVEETLQGITNVKAFANEAYECSRYRNSLENYLKAVLQSAMYRAAFVAFIVFALFGSIVFVLWSGARMVESGQLTAGALTQFMLYTMFMGGAMNSFAELYSEVQRTLGASQRVRELLTETPEAINLDFTLAAATSIGAAHRRIRGEVVFERVSFNYPSRKRMNVVNELSLEARPGERIALVGPSGAGKSTTVALLLRFYEPDAGRVLIDGIDAREYELTSLRSQMAIVPQDVMLFGGSIAANIAYGKPGASEAEITDAARKANAHDFISSFPEGYETIVGERGVQLSGGQRQRVAIARAILRNPAILILDEATSALDSESESLVQQALEGLMCGRTSFIIAHRLATIRSADRIFVIQDGTVIESGTHADLLANTEGLYRALCALQFDLSTADASELANPMLPGRI